MKHPLAAALAFTLATFFLVVPAGSQTVVNPRIVEFIPSDQHDTLLPSGGAAVTEYLFEIYLSGAAQPFQVGSLGKPSPAADGLIHYDFSASLFAWPLADGTYVSRVAAVGPAGVGLSDPSNTFTFDSTPACSYAVSPSTVAAPAGGGVIGVTVNAAAGCAWNVYPYAGWISANPATGSGAGTLNLVVSASAGSARIGTVSVEGQTVTVTQSAASASATLTVSSNPSPGVTVLLNPADVNGATGGPTDMTRTYQFGAMVGLNAWPMDSRLKRFVKWLKDGADFSTSSYIELAMDTDHSLVALYEGYTTSSAPTPGATPAPNPTPPPATTPSGDPTLTVSSPSGQVTVLVNPTDLSGLAGGQTALARTYRAGTVVAVNAWPMDGNGKRFISWLKDGVECGTSWYIEVVMDTSHALTAVYEGSPASPSTTPIPAPTPTPAPVPAAGNAVLTVASTPAAGVTVVVDPDLNGAGTGPTAMTRIYPAGYTVNVNAWPVDSNFRQFVKWQKDGVDYTTSRYIQIVLDGNHTLTAVYR